MWLLLSPEYGYVIFANIVASAMNMVSQGGSNHSHRRSNLFVKNVTILNRKKGPYSILSQLWL